MMLLLLIACVGSDEPTSPIGATEPAPRGDLLVLTYNVHGLPDALTGDDGAARMEQIAPMLPDFDVIGLQESFDDEKHALLTADADHSIQAWSDETLDSTRAYGNGLGLLIRGFEEVEREAVFYSACSGVLDGASDCLASKGLLRVRVRVPGTETLLDIYDTHHEAGGGPDDLVARDVQVGEVIAAMEATSGDAAILFMGDTNMHADDPDDAVALARYEAFGLRDACTEVACDEPDHIDRIFLRDGPELAWTVTGWAVDERFYDDGGVPLSDHPAVTAELSWSR
jgi:endonuclease/exonuclease/phosphatase family metal-dependent hydrolase